MVARIFIFMAFTRIKIDPGKMGGELCIRDLRMPGSTIVKLCADGWTTEQILADWPDSEMAGLSEALRFAAEAPRVHQFPTL